jgi:UMF1 family MFS transporter
VNAPAPAFAPEGAVTPAPRRAIAAWLLFDWAAQPFFTLVTTFVFAPFFVSALASSPVQGQALWGYATGAAGLIIALCSPVLGAIADAAGGRKPWIAAFGAALVLGCGLLWFAVPGAPYAVAIALAGFMLATIGAEFATVFNNAMIPSLVPPRQVGRLSGYGWAMGYVGGLVSLLIALGFFAAQPATGLTLLGLPPVLGLDPALREGDRIVGPFTSLWFLVFVLPLFLAVPDTPRRLPLAKAARTGLGELRATLTGLRHEHRLARFLLGNMLAADALVALFAFGGIYAAGVFGWGSIEIGIFGILLTVTGTFGAVVGGVLDDRIGAKPVILGSLAMLTLTCLAIAGTTREVALFVIPSTTLSDGLYGTTSERVYLALGLLIGAVAGPLQAASRSLLVRLAPPQRIGQCFGLFALSGKVTSFIGPTLVAVVTQAADSQRAGVVVLVAMFALAMLVLGPLRVPRAVP